MKKITKKEINEFLTNAPLLVGAYAKNGEWHLYHNHGSIPATVHNEEYDQIIDFKDAFAQWKSGADNKQNLVNHIYNSLNEGELK